MAQSQYCDLCKQEPADVTIITNASGDVIMIGASCMIIFYLTAAAEILDAMPGENRKAYAEVLHPIVEKLAGFAVEGAAAPLMVYPDDSAQADGGGGDVPQDGAQDRAEGICGASPYESGSEGDDGTMCLLPAGHDGPHDDMPGGSDAR
jgi:hypothetical protein